VIYCTSRGRIERTLTRIDGSFIVPSAGATVVNGNTIVNEAPEIVGEIWQASIRIGNKLNEEGAFTELSVWNYRKSMMKYIKWREGRRNDTEFEKHSMASVGKFGDLRLHQIDFKKVQNWIDHDIASKYANNTIKHKINSGKSLFNWLKKQGVWQGENPFEGHEWIPAKPGLFIKSTISPEEWQLIQNLTEPLPKLRQVLTLAYFTGLRPTEIFRIRPEDFNHEGLMLTVKVKKTGNYNRLIAIPSALSTWVLNWEWQDAHEKNAQNYLCRIRKGHQPLYGLTMESFRRNYISVMEIAGCSLDYVDAHQGRYQNSVSKHHYLRDQYRAVNLMRPYMRVFDGDSTSPLRLVK